jgi:holliday junction DNA helicase RuvA
VPFHCIRPGGGAANRRGIYWTHEKQEGWRAGWEPGQGRHLAQPVQWQTMIAHLRGKLIEKEPGQAIVEAAGVGYDVTISVPTFTALPSVGAEASLHIHTQVSEDQIALFGFMDREEKRLFERLITVSGVGPKLAIKMLSGLSPERTVQAIRGQDHAQLTRIPGVGKKLAERLVVELKDKLDDFAVAPVAGRGVQGAAVDDVLSALVNLGYQRPAAEKAIEQAVAKDAVLKDNFDELFRGALKVIR